MIDDVALHIGEDPVHPNGFRPLVGLGEFGARLHEELHVGNEWSEQVLNRTAIGTILGDVFDGDGRREGLQFAQVEKFSD